MKKIAVLSLMAFLVLTLSGCYFTEKASEKAGEKIIEKAIESQVGGEVDIKNDGTDISVKSSQGSINLSQNGGIPVDFPKDIFVYPDAKVKVSYVGNGGKESNITYLTSVSPETALIEYKKKMIENGWKANEQVSIAGNSANGGGFGMLQFSKEDRELAVSISLKKQGEGDEKDKTYVSVVSVVKK